MPYRGGELVDLAGPLEHGVGRFATRATREVGDDLRTRVRRHTPVAHPSAADVASYAGAVDWEEARHRRPGRLRDSWEAGDVEVISRAAGGRRRVVVFTLDPVAPHVEWDTMPHVIRPKRAKALTVPTVGGMTLRRSVQHPGTRGQHMMARALGEVAVTWRVTVGEQWAVETRRIWTGG
jgi:hypothetical protein